MTTDLIAAARARLDAHGSSPVMQEMRALIEALDEMTKARDLWREEYRQLAQDIGDDE